MNSGPLSEQMQMPKPDVVKIRALNDRARKSFPGCRVAITQGIRELGHDAIHTISGRNRTLTYHLRQTL